MKQRLKKIFATVAALITAAVILDVFCSWYYNPTAYLREESRSTDTKREANAFTSRATEGFAWCVTDENGYNNASVPEGDIFVLAMGSSHLEGFNVMQDENMASRLEALLAENGVGGSVYNIGMSSHIFTRNVGNLDRALERFSPTGYVLLETQDIAITRKSLNKAIKSKYGRLKATNVNLPDFITDRPLLRTLYNQYMGLTQGEESAKVRKLKDKYLEEYKQAILELMQHINGIAEKHGVKAIVCYHPHMVINADGTVTPQADKNCRLAFEYACEEAGVIFVDMTQPFTDEYQRSKSLPHGFANTSPGVGHLNKTGHELIAQALSEEISRLEAEK